MKLYTYCRSSAAYRVRIALEWKGIERTDVYVDLKKSAHHDAEYAALNPQRLVPLLIDGDLALAQSLAILEYLEETHPWPPLLPGDAAGRARVRQLALAIACDVHPLQNLGVTQTLTAQFDLEGEAAARFASHWIERGLAAVEALLACGPETGRFCHGDAPSLADVLLVPQVYNARRREIDLEGMPTIRRIDERCSALEAFRRAAPEVQPDWAS